MVYQNRQEAGQLLSRKLEPLAGDQNTILLALPRGGVVVAAEVSRVLNLPLNVILVRKLSVPGDPEYAIGAISETGEIVWNEKDKFILTDKAWQKVIDQEKMEIDRRIMFYRQGQSLKLHGKTVILIDDGVATGLTVRAGVKTLKKLGAGKVIVAVPHGSPNTMAKLRAEADEVIALQEPASFISVGKFYVDFDQVTDEEVLRLLRR